MDDFKFYVGLCATTKSGNLPFCRAHGDDTDISKPKRPELLPMQADPGIAKSLDSSRVK